MRLTVVGCSGSFAGPQSAASCYLVEADDDQGRTWRVVLDLGSGALGALQQYVALDAVDAVLLSHLHPDHFIDMCGLYVALRYDPAGPRQEQLVVHGPTGTLARLEQAYGAHQPGSIAKTFEVREWVDGDTVAVGPIAVTARRVDHPVEAYGMRLEVGGVVLTYTGDTDSCDNLIELARGADLLLAEASFVEGRDLDRGVHLTGLRAGQAAQEAGAKELVLTHLPVWTDASVVLAEAVSAYPGPTRVAQTGLVVQL